MMTVFMITLFLMYQVPILTLAALFFFTTRFAVDLLNLLTVFKKEIDSQGKLIEMVTSTAYGYVVFYQICMVLFLTQSKSLDEAVLVTVILVVTVAYISVKGGKINDLSLYETKKPKSGIELDLLLKEWRQDYDHPSQVTKVGTKRQDLLAKKTKDVDNWDNYIKDPQINNLWMVNPLGGGSQKFSPTPAVE